MNRQRAPTWAQIKRVTAGGHGPFVGDIEERTLRPLPYSPRSVFGDSR